jgi:hypothetical protein
MNTFRIATVLGLAILPTTAFAGEVELDDVVLLEETYEAAVEHVPWSGSWWAFQSGELSKGYFGPECFTYDEDTEDFTKVTQPDNDLSPLLKYDLFVERRTGTNPEAAYLELKGDEDKDFHHHVYGARKQDFDDRGVSYSWWGHCNGWAAAAVMEREPVSPLVAEGIRFDVADQKGLLTESYWGVRSDFSGRRYNKPSDEMRAKVDRGQELLDALGTNDEHPIADFITWYEDIYDRDIEESVEANLTPENFRNTLEYVRDWAIENWEDAYKDIYPHVFHKILVTHIKNRRSAVVFDITANEEVWNFPAYYFDTDVQFTEDLPNGEKSWTVATTVYYAHDGVSESILGVNRLEKSYTYTLITDADGRPTGGEWTGSSVDNHPDFAWVPTYNPLGEDRGENPNVLYGKILEIVASDHAHGPRDMELMTNASSGDSVKQSDRIGAQATSTWDDAVEVTSPVSLSVQRSSDSAIVKVRYSKNSVNAGSRFPTVARGDMTVLGEASTGDTLGGSFELDLGKHHLIAQGFNSQDRLISVSELTVQVVAGPTPTPDPDPTPDPNPTPDPDPTPTNDDAFEPNNTRAQAAVLAQGTTSLKVRDDDWFKVDLVAGERATFTAAFPHAQGDIDIKSYDSAGTALGTSESTGDSETLEVTASSATTFFLRVYGYSGAENDVQLTLAIEGGTTTPPPTSADDAFESNDALVDATALAPGNYPGLEAAGNDDWFKIDAPAGTSVTVTITFNHSAGDLDMSSHDASGSRQDTSQGTSNTETLTGTGVVFVRVYGYSGARGTYSLEVTQD